MTPKEKANDILDKFWLLDKVKPMLTEKQAKQCALISVDEIIKSHNNLYGVNGVKTKFYLEVQQEIEKL